MISPWGELRPALKTMGSSRWHQWVIGAAVAAAFTVALVANLVHNVSQGDPVDLTTSSASLTPDFIFAILKFVLLAAGGAFLLHHRGPKTGFISGIESVNLCATYENRPTIHGYSLVDGNLTVEDVIRSMEKAGIPVKRFKRFSYAVTKDWQTLEPFDPEHDWPGYFYVDPTFRLSNHVRYLESGMTSASLLAWLAKVINTPPDLSRPPWEIVLCPNFDGKEQTAVIFRVHHVLADGLALVSFMDAITEPADGADAKDSSLAAAALVGLKLMMNQSLVVRLFMYARLVIEFPIAMFKDYILPFPDRNVFKGKPLTGKKKLGWAMNRLDMERVKVVKNALNVKINDLFLSCCAGTLQALAKRAAAEQEGELPAEIKVYSPISVRESVAQCDDLNNMLSVLMIPLPTAMDDKVKRLKRIERMMNGKKQSIVPWGLAKIMGPMGNMPRLMLRTQMQYLYNKVSAVLTNVPGPSNKRTISGKTIEQMMFWVPGLGPIGIVLSLFSYGDRLSMGVVVDDSLPFEPDEFIDEFFREFEEYEAGVMEVAMTKGAAGERVQ